FDVAITRAKQTCVITFAKSRFKHGQNEPARQSRFLDDIDPKFLKTETTSFRDSGKEGSTGGFWDSMRQRSQASKPAFKQRETVAPPRPRGTPISQTSSVSTLSKEAIELQEGQTIEHERFGVGTVITIENSGNDRRAHVEFETAGRKQLLLKFAKFKIK
ncbi:MAG: ATP-dependent DNA helicase, partial [Dysgonamonadaceae bacterium]|nr:ATP-dependent DNA helicase [Dysgonamonadaceae bacterium]